MNNMWMSLQVRGQTQIPQFSRHIYKEKSTIIHTHTHTHTHAHTHHKLTSKIMSHNEVEDTIGYKLCLIPSNAFHVESLQLGLALVELPSVSLHTSPTTSNMVSWDNLHTHIVQSNPSMALIHNNCKCIAYPLNLWPRAHSTSQYHVTAHNREQETHSKVLTN